MFKINEDKKMKIGILTFHRAYNFGAQLQAYGLQQFLCGCGHDVELIDYRNEAIESFYDLISWKAFFRASFRGKLCLLYFILIAGRSWKRREKHFNDFINNFLRISKTSSNNIHTLDLSVYDLIVVGSDQIWSPLLTRGFDPAYWGDFDAPESVRKITYAASCGDISQFSSAQCELLRKKLNNFSRISVREESLRQFCNQLVDRPIYTVLDPTLLVDRSEFYKITSDRIFPFPYVLVYAVESHPQLLAVARKLAKRCGARIVHVAMSNLKDRIVGKDRDIIKYDPSIPDLLGLFKYAECTVTLSFHGVALSIVYEKDFYALRGQKMSRVNSLLTQLELMDRIIDGVDQVDGSSIDFRQVNSKLEKLRLASMQYLKESL